MANTNLAAVLDAAEEFDHVIVDSPTMLFVGVQRDRPVWTYASVLVKPSGTLFRPVAAEITRRGLRLVEEREVVDAGVMFGRAVERRFA